jgi:hypothetical protein
MAQAKFVRLFFRLFVWNDSRCKFEFSSLRRNKFSPVFIHGLAPLNSIECNQLIDPSIHFLCEIRRPPFMSYLEGLGDDKSETEVRIPGPTLIGRANAWIVRLQPDLESYETFSSILVKYRLCEKKFQADNLVDLLRTSNENSHIFSHIDVLLLKEWIKENQNIMDRFGSQRWPLFPFETKFEIMKLISKHIITINDSRYVDCLYR